MVSQPASSALSTDDGTSAARLSPWRSLASRGLLMLLVFALAVFLRTQELRDFGVSFDESFVLKMVEFDWNEMLTRIGQDTHPPLFYVILRVWQLVFGKSLLAGRLLSVSWGLVGVVAMFFLVGEAGARHTLNPRENWQRTFPAALLAAFLLALSPLHLHWTMQVRMYSLPVALALISSWFTLRLTRPAPTTRDWWIYGLTIIALAYAHYFAWFIIAGQFLFLFGKALLEQPPTRFARLRSCTCVASAFTLGVWPWLPVLFDQRARVRGEFYLDDLSWEVFGRVNHELWVGVGTAPIPLVGIVLAQLSLFVLLAALAHRTQGSVLLIILTLSPVAALVGISTLSQPMFTARYLLFPHLFLLAALSLQICRLPRPIALLTGFVVVALVGQTALEHRLWRARGAKLTGIRGAMERLDEVHNNDPLIISNPMLFTSALVYTDDHRQIYNFQPEYRFPFYQGTPVMRESEFLNSSQITELSTNTLWTLGADGYMGQVPLPSEWRLLHEEVYPEWFAKVTLRLYQREERP